MNGKLILENKSKFIGKSFGAEKSIAGEVVFSTGMMGYPESLTDPSYKGQIIVFTYPLIGNYGVANKEFWESNHIQASGIIVSNYNDTPSHFQSKKTLGQWLKDEGIPGLEIPDTRFLTQLIRTKGTMLGKIVLNNDVTMYDPNLDNLVAQVSTKEVTPLRWNLNQGSTSRKKTILLIDCGAKANIIRCLLKRGVRVVIVPWDFDPLALHLEGVKLNFDAVVVSNGPGDPKIASKTIENIKKLLNKRIPILGICLGHQLLALAAGGDTQKLKFGHRSQNQPCILEGTKRCYITTQNHGFHVAKIPKRFKPWFTNGNDGSNEGIIHKSLPFMSVQFHPEATPGPIDTEWIFDFFLEKINF